MFNDDQLTNIASKVIQNVLNNIFSHQSVSTNVSAPVRHSKSFGNENRKEVENRVRSRSVENRNQAELTAFHNKLHIMQPPIKKKNIFFDFDQDSLRYIPTLMKNLKEHSSIHFQVENF